MKIAFLFVNGLLIIILIQSQYSLPAMAVDSELDILISHGGVGETEICFESNGYRDLCDDINLSRYESPFAYLVDVEDPDEGDEFRICYEVRGEGLNGCREFEFNGRSSQTVSITIPQTSEEEISQPPSPENFEIENETTSSPPQSPSSPPALPPLPPLS